MIEQINHLVLNDISHALSQSPLLMYYEVALYMIRQWVFHCVDSEKTVSNHLVSVLLTNCEIWTDSLLFTMCV